MSNLKRVRVKTHSPISAFQAWMVLDSNQSIQNFKISILELINQQSGDPIKPTNQYSHQQIQLESQGFAFLDQCECSVIDVVSVKLRSGSNHQKSKKRSRTSTSTSTPTNPSLTLNLTQSKPQAEVAQEKRIVKPLPVSTIPTEPISKPLESNPIKPVVPGSGTSRTKARNLRKRKRKSLLRQQENSIKASDENAPDRIKGNEAEAVKRSNPVNVEDEKRRLNSKDSSVKIPIPLNQEFKSSSSKCSTESSETSKSDSNSSSGSSSDSESDSNTESDTQSSTPSSAPIKPFLPISTLTPKPVQVIQQKIVPIIQNESFKMLSLSNKNKRKNLRSSSNKPNQSSKIVFCSDDHQEKCSRLSSPKYTPNSPTFEDSESSASQLDKSLDDDQIGSNINHSKAPHAPPPSLRDPSSIPSNIQITWIDVEDPNWFAGQINPISSSFPNHPQETLNTEQTTSKRKRAQNRKKQGKKNKRAKAAKLRNESIRPSEDEDDEEDEYDVEIEDEYAEFIKSGGHSKGKKIDEEKPLIEERELDLKKRVVENWYGLEKIEAHQTKIGDRIALKVIELSIESLTPELITYFGTLLQTNPISFKLSIDPSCLPKLTSDQPLEPQEEDLEEEGVRETNSALRERELIKESYRDSLMEDIWNGEAGNCRDWNWAEVAEVRRLGSLN
ncbi:hypothetical protein DFH28DRAFT_993972 [Melampsora americana]|nr:hypothetical protein DFH28DRAFT_993972 [Melampsora americana]